MTDERDPPDSDGEPDDEIPSAFAAMLRDGVRRRGLSLRSIRERLADRGYDVSVSILSLWQSGARRPERATSIDVIRELEDILRLDDGALTDTMGPSRRIGSSRHETYAELVALPRDELTSEPEPELFERSGSVGIQLDAGGRIVGTVNRTVWQARRDGARRATVFYGFGEGGPAELDIEGTIGCDLVDIVADPERDLIRATLQLHSPLQQGELALTERRSTTSNPTAPDDGITIVAPRRQAEVMLYVVFDRARIPRRCRVIVEAGDDSRTHTVSINGDCATHAEFNFGPGMITLQWDW